MNRWLVPGLWRFAFFVKLQIDSSYLHTYISIETTVF